MPLKFFGFVSPKWKYESPQPTVGNVAFAAQAVIVRPPLGEKISAEDNVPDRQMDGEVLVDRLALGAMAPMMETERRQDALQGAQFPAHVRVNERRLNHNDQYVGGNRRLGKSHNIDWHVRRASGDDGVHQMQSRSRQPVHLFGPGVDRVELPEVG